MYKKKYRNILQKKKSLICLDFILDKSGVTT